MTSILSAGEILLRAHEPFCQKLQAKPCRNAPTSDEDLKQFVSAMWAAFPKATSENDLARKVAKHLNQEGRPVSERTIRYWLRKSTTPHFSYVTRALNMIEDDATLLRIIRGRR